MHLFRLLSALALAAALAGCASVESAHKFNHVRTNAGNTPISTVSVQNTGWFLLDWLPLCCGDPESPNLKASRFFTNTVTLENNLRMLDAKMRQEGATCFANLTTHNYDQSYLFMLVCRRSLHTSAVILKE